MGFAESGAKNPTFPGFSLRAERSEEDFSTDIGIPLTNQRMCGKIYCMTQRIGGYANGRKGKNDDRSSGKTFY